MSSKNLSNGELYKFIEKHRTFGFKDASRWIITRNEEYKLADDSIELNYVEENKKCKQAYNLLKNANKIEVVGKNFKNDELKLGKFINSYQNEWHGYPADYCRNNQDRPNQNTLKKLLDDGKIDKKQMRRISQGNRGL